jgi:hypothetical protein
MYVELLAKTCGMYVESCMILVGTLVMIRDPSWYSTDYRAYMGSSMTVWLLRCLPLLLCSYNLVGCVTQPQRPSSPSPLRSAPGSDGGPAGAACRMVQGCVCFFFLSMYFPFQLLYSMAPTNCLSVLCWRLGFQRFVSLDPDRAYGCPRPKTGLQGIVQLSLEMIQMSMSYCTPVRLRIAWFHQIFCQFTNLMSSHTMPCVSS